MVAIEIGKTLTLFQYKQGNSYTPCPFIIYFVPGAVTLTESFMCQHQHFRTIIPRLSQTIRFTNFPIMPNWNIKMNTI